MTRPMTITVGTKDLSEDDAVSIALALGELVIDTGRPKVQRRFLSALVHALADDHDARNQALNDLEAACDDPLAGWYPPDPPEQ